MYGRDVAEIHDDLNESRGKDYRTEAEYITEVVRSRFPGARSLLDIGCGAGGHLVHFAEFFDTVGGIELSEDMLAVARGKLPGAGLHQGDMRGFDLGREFDAVVCLFGSVGHTRDEDELRQTLRCFGRHLSAGGVVVVEPWWFLEKSVDGFISGDVVRSGRSTIARMSHTARSGHRSTMDVHFLVADPETGVRHFAETYTHTLFSRAQYEAAFAAAGFDADYIEDVQGGRGLFVAAAAEERP